jgi:hypothetical protein
VFSIIQLSHPVEISRFSIVWNTPDLGKRTLEDKEDRGVLDSTENCYKTLSPAVLSWAHLDLKKTTLEDPSSKGE